MNPIAVLLTILIEQYYMMGYSFEESVKMAGEVFHKC